MFIFPNPLPSWLTVKESPTFPKWQLQRLEYIDTTDPRNNGSTNAYLKALDKQGVYQAGLKVWQAWPTDRASELTKKQGDLKFNNEDFGIAFFQSGDSSFDPNRGQSGPYVYYVDGNSDEVHGCGLPLRRHIQFLMVWQWVDQTPPPPTGKWQITNASIPAQDETHIALVISLEKK